jgi:hypothetical protein
MVSVNGKIVKTLTISTEETQIDVSALLPKLELELITMNFSG